MSSPGSVTGWIIELHKGNQDAAQKLWERYYRRLVGLARKKLHGSPRRRADEEDAAIVAFENFCRGLKNDKFPLLKDRDDLWRLLVVITARKALDIKEKSPEHGGVWVFTDLADPDTASGIDHAVGREPSPHFAAEVAEQCQRLLGLLDQELRQVALWKMEGFTNEEIAQKQGCVVRTVERQLKLIRSIWVKRGMQ